MKQLLIAVTGVALLAAPVHAISITDQFTNSNPVAAGHGYDGCSYTVYKSVGVNHISDDDLNCLQYVQNDYEKRGNIIEDKDATITDLTTRLDEAEAAVRNKAQQILELTTELDQVKADRDGWKADAERLQGIADNLVIQVSSLEDQVEILQDQIELLNNTIATHESTIDTLTDQNETLTDHLAQAQETIETHENTISAQQATIAAQNATISEQASTIAERDETISNQALSITELEGIVASALSQVQAIDVHNMTPNNVATAIEALEQTLDQ